MPASDRLLAQEHAAWSIIAVPRGLFGGSIPNDMTHIMDGRDLWNHFHLKVPKKPGVAVAGGSRFLYRLASLPLPGSCGSQGGVGSWRLGRREPQRRETRLGIQDSCPGR